MYKSAIAPRIDAAVERFEVRVRLAIVVSLLVVSGLLAACAPDRGGTGYGLVVQNKFRPDNCQQIMTKTAAVEARIQELEGLTRTARRDTGGTLIAATVYGPDLNVAYADLRQLRRERIAKNCDAAPPPAR